MALSSTSSVEVSNAVYRFHHSHFQHVSNICAAVATPRQCTSSNSKSSAISAAMIAWRLIIPARLVNGRAAAVTMAIGWDILRTQWRATCRTLCRHKSPMSSHREELSLRQCYLFQVSSMLAPLQRFRRFWGESFCTFDTYWIFILTFLSFADFWSHHRTATCTSIRFPSTVVNVSWWRNMVSAPQASFVENKVFFTRNCFSLSRTLDLKNIDHATTQQDKTNQQQQQAQPTQPVPINAPSSNANSSKTSSSED